MASRESERRQLEGELRGRAYQELLHRLQDSEGPLRHFRTWGEVAAFVAEVSSEDAERDDVLRPIFRAHRKDGDPRWGSILLLIFWPRLEWIHQLKHRWDADREELWQKIVWIFLQVVSRIDVDRRPDGLARKLVNDTIHRLHDECRREWTRLDREILTNPADLESLSGGTEGAGLTEAELREGEDAAIRRLRRHRAEGHLSEADLFLLVGTFVYGRSLAEYTREARLSYEAARKRRQRALAVLRRYETRG